MSQKSFVDFYENYLNSPDGEALRSQIDGSSDAEAFVENAVNGGKSAGFDFSPDDVREVMKASEAQMAMDLARASGEIPDDQLEALAGGVSLSLTSIPKVNITTLPSYLDPGQLEYRTVMCPW